MLNNTTEREQSTVTSCTTTRSTRLNRGTILILLTLAAVAVMAIVIPSSHVSSAVSSLASGGAEINRPAATAPHRSAGAPKENHSGSRSVGSDKTTLEFSPAHTALAPEPFQGGTQVMVNFDDVPPFTNVENRYANVKFSSPLRSVEARDYWAPPTSPPNTASACCDLNAGFGDFIATFPQAVNDPTFTVNAPDKIGPIA